MKLWKASVLQQDNHRWELYPALSFLEESDSGFAVNSEIVQDTPYSCKQKESLANHSIDYIWNDVQLMCCSVNSISSLPLCSRYSGKLSSIVSSSYRLQEIWQFRLPYHLVLPCIPLFYSHCTAAPASSEKGWELFAGTPDWRTKGNSQCSSG